MAIFISEAFIKTNLEFLDFVFAFQRIGPLSFFQDVEASRHRCCPLDKRIKRLTPLTPSLTSAMKFVNLLSLLNFSSKN